MKVCKKSYDVATRTSRFDFANGTTISLRLDDLPEATITQAALHGINQKIGDDWNKAESVEEAIAIAKHMIGRLHAGDWNTGRAVGGILPEALHRATGEPMDKCIEAIGKLDDKGKKALRADPVMKRYITEIDLERAKAKEEAARLQAGDEGGVSLTGLFG